MTGVALFDHEIRSAAARRDGGDRGRHALLDDDAEPLLVGGTDEDRSVPVRGRPILEGRVRRALDAGSDAELARQFFVG